MRDMGARTGVPIEPAEQTALLDACVALPGVLASGVPGAGGYDALWLLVLVPAGAGAGAAPAEAAERLWAGWKGLDVSPLGAEESIAAGCRLEDVETVPGLAAAIGQ
jgi:phosphomevalonate kinase